MRDAPVDLYSTPLAAIPDCWTELMVDSLTSIAGHDEAFVNDIQIHAQNLKASHESCVFNVIWSPCLGR